MARRRTKSSGGPSRIVRLADWKATENRIDEFTSGVYSIGGPIRCVRLGKRAEKQLRRVPAHIRAHLFAWINIVETDGLETARRVPGYHDEPLLGRRASQRSIRLSRSYRAVYRVLGARARFVSVEEVTKHDY